jgi:trehalose-6-phosphate synthase
MAAAAPTGDVVDARDRVLVPPGQDDYWLRRVWLTPEEEQGYYYGFANEGLWPLCHVAHVRPVFRESDWEAYRAVNQRFADAVIAEARGEDPVVLVQDYHFALLPAMIREKLPQATILTFWHIPWPNPESFGICPWRREILQGMLGSTILGFHTRFHCKNFIETVDRYWRRGSSTNIRPSPSRKRKPWSRAIRSRLNGRTRPRWAGWAPVEACRRRVIEWLELPVDVCLAVGVDRFDYTKGILERLNAVERLLEKWPSWIGRFVFVQVAAPTRGALDEYRSFQERVQRTSERINERFGRPGYQPVHLLAQHHEHDAVFELFRAANICVVTSLHDGMNLVCKEFVAARDDLQGVLLLSRFAGAARELSEALIVNPYHVEETADALHRAATMPVGEQRERMASLRSTGCASSMCSAGQVACWPTPGAGACGRASRRGCGARAQTEMPLRKAPGGMQHLFTPAGEVALAATLLRRPLLAFDFDGTLAPIVARPRRRPESRRPFRRDSRAWRHNCPWRS